MRTTDGLIFLVLIAVSSIVVGGCKSAPYTKQGAALGAVTGALAGTAIGGHNNRPGAGAVIGTAVGALTGAAIGDSIDQDLAHSQAIIEQQMGRRMAGAVSVPDVIAMTQAGLSEDVISSHIRANGVAQRPVVEDLITLRNAGVTDGVIQTLQQTPPPSIPVAHPGGPIIVEEHHYVAPPHPAWRYHHHRHARHPRSGVSWGVSFGR